MIGLAIIKAILVIGTIFMIKDIFTQEIKYIPFIRVVIEVMCFAGLIIFTSFINYM